MSPLAQPARRHIVPTDLSECMSNDRMREQLAFLAEIDALKTIVRQSPLANRSRRENSAEHSWHLAMFALVFADDATVDTARVIQMLLVHDIVEIDAGDTPIHGEYDPKAVEARERAAADRLFGILPEDQAANLLALWQEFEAAQTPEARFAKALDRLQPLLLNTLTGGGTWAENGVSEADVLARYGPTIERGSTALWRHARTLVERHFADAGVDRG
ncbi:metal dependent phosphohydrolase [Salinisphaera hydrothermalis EPR70]